MVVIKCFTLRCENQTRLVERIPAEHAAHRIRNELLDDILSEFLVTHFRSILRICERDVALQRHAFQQYIARHVITHAIRIRNHLVITDLTLALFLRYTIPVLTKMRYRLFKQISHLCTLIRIEQRESLEIPRCLERVPILRRDTNYLCNDGFS